MHTLAYTELGYDIKLVQVKGGVSPFVSREALIDKVLHCLFVRIQCTQRKTQYYPNRSLMVAR